MPTIDATAAREKAELEWKASAAVREEFCGNKDAFVAFSVANATNKVKIQGASGKGNFVATNR